MSECKLKNVFTRSLNSGGSCREARLNYLVSGLAVDGEDPGAEALALVRETAPDEVDGARLDRVTLTKSHGNGLFEVQAAYEQSATDRQSRKRIGEKLWLFDTTGGRENVLHGTLIRSGAPAGSGTPPDPGSLINWNGRNGSAFQVRGVSKIIPSMHECCIVVRRNSDLTGHFRRTVMGLTGCVNSKSFHSWEPGEVLFLGASGGVPFRNDQGVLLVEVTYRFAVRKNADDLHYAGVSLGRAEGWQIPWSIPAPVSGGGSVGVMGAYLSAVYEKADFSPLKLE